jgi:hypothetical protein
MTTAGLVAKKKIHRRKPQADRYIDRNRSYTFIAPFTASAVISRKP